MVATGVISLTSRFLGLLEKLNLNYFRVHLLWFTINPLFWSVIFFLSNGRFRVSYVDSLFLCVSAQTVTGLSPINASTLTGFQQAILFYLMAVGNYTITSYVMVLIRKHYFIARVLKDRPGRTPLSRLGSMIRSKTIAVFGDSNNKPSALQAPYESEAFDRASPQGHPLAKIESAHELERREFAGSTPNPVSQLKSPDEVDLGMGTKKQRVPLPPILPPSKIESSDLPPSTPFASPSPDNILTTSPTSISGTFQVPGTPRTPFQNLFGEPLQLNESPAAMDDTEASLPSKMHVAFSPQGQFRPAHPSPLGVHQALPLNRSGTVTLSAVPGPQRQGTGLLFSSSQTRSLSKAEATGDTAFNGIPRTQSQPLANAQALPIQNTELIPMDKQTPTYEQGFGGFPTPLTLTARFVKRFAPDPVGRLRRKLTINEGALYVPASSNRKPKDTETDAPWSHTSSTAFSQGLSHAHIRHHHPAYTQTSVQDHGKADPSQDADHVQNRTIPMVESLAPPHLHNNHLPNVVIPEHLRHSRPVYHHNKNQSSEHDWMEDLQEGVKKTVNYITQGVLKVGRNSAFNTDELTDAQLEELGGVEYRALRVLSWIIGLYFVGTQLVTFLILTGYLLSTSKYDGVFSEQPRNVPKAWFAAFQAMSSYTGGGLTLVDQGMIPLRAAYVIVLSQGMLIIAGNMGMAIFLRLTVWTLSKIAPEHHQEPLQFLLDHPRRCYLYLFPSHQTWFLVVVFLILSFIEWFGFLILDIGLDAIEAIPVGERVLAGLFQSIAVRASGFAIVPLGAIAPAVKFLYVVMMYISAYPIAMSVRSTNVYEQRSLGIYEELTPAEAAKGADPDVDESAAKLVKDQEGEVLFSKYLGMHIRRQLSYDLWWLAAAMFLICIVERTEIMNPDNEVWFNQFQILFELVSAYATVGLSLGIPTENYSFSGALRPLSKLILCAVMIRGRHRDLPQAVDRAILLPHEFSRSRVDEEGRHVLDNCTLEQPSLPTSQPIAPQVTTQEAFDEKKVL